MAGKIPRWDMYVKTKDSILAAFAGTKKDARNAREAITNCNCPLFHQSI